LSESNHFRRDGPVRLRDASRADFDQTEAIFTEWFPSTLSIDDEEYKTLLERGGYVRLAQAEGPFSRAETVGFYSVWPISRRTFESLVEGTRKEKELTAMDVLQFDDHQAEVLYIPEIAIRRRSKYGPRLLRDALQYIRRRLTEHANLQTVALWAYSPNGRRLARKLGMKRTFGRGSSVTASFYSIDRDAALASSILSRRRLL
jgi:hypothetical protein